MPFSGYVHKHVGKIQEEKKWKTDSCSNGAGYSPRVVVVGLVVRWMRIEDIVQYGSGAFEQLPVLVDRFHHHGRCRRIKIHRVDRPVALLR